MERITKRHDNVTVVGAPCESFGIHHTKMSMFESADGLIHVIVSTANFVSDDWEFKTQQFYYAVGIKCASEKDTKRFIKVNVELGINVYIPDLHSSRISSNTSASTVIRYWSGER